MTELVVIGFIRRPHGVGGAVRVRGTGPTLERLAVGDRVGVRTRGAPVRELHVAAVTGAPPDLILEFTGVEDRDAAALLTGAELLVPPDALPRVDEADTFYVRDLVGCRVLVGERPLGDVVAVHPGPANDSLEVAGADGPVLLPFTADAVVELDVAGRRVVIRPDLLG